jgi:hypothetical protein
MHDFVLYLHPPKWSWILNSGGNSTMKVAPLARGSARMPQPFDGVASNKRLPFRLGTALESIQKYAAGAVPSYVNPCRIAFEKS